MFKRLLLRKVDDMERSGEGPRMSLQQHSRLFCDDIVIGIC